MSHKISEPISPEKKAGCNLEDYDEVFFTGSKLILQWLRLNSYSASHGN